MIDSLFRLIQLRVYDTLIHLPLSSSSLREHVNMSLHDKWM